MLPLLLLWESSSVQAICQRVPVPVFMTLAQVTTMGHANGKHCPQYPSQGTEFTGASHNTRLPFPSFAEQEGLLHWSTPNLVHSTETALLKYVGKSAMP